MTVTHASTPPARATRAQVILLSSEVSMSSEEVPVAHEGNNDRGWPPSTTRESWWPASSDVPTAPDLTAERNVFVRDSDSRPGKINSPNMSPKSGKSNKPPTELTNVTISPISSEPISVGKLAELLTLFCMCHVCIGFSMGAISPAMETISSHFQLTDTWRGLLGAAALTGNTLGSPMGGWLADTFGRRTCMIVAWLVFILSATDQALVGSISHLCAARFFLGWSVGSHYAGTTAYLSETLQSTVAKKADDGPFTRLLQKGTGFWLSMVEAHFFIGNFLSLGMGYVFERTVADPNIRWRVTISCCAIPVVVGVVWFLWRAPETSSWKKSHRTVHTETQTQSDEVGDDYARIDVDAATCSSRCTSLSQVSLSPDPPQPEMSLAASIFFVSFFWGTLVAPTYAVSAFAVFIIKSLDLSIDAFKLNACLGAAAAAGVFLGVFTIDRLGRKKLLLLSQWGVGAAFLVLALLKPNEQGASAYLGYLLIGAFLLFEVLNGAGSPLAMVYPAEIFPSKVRGLASGISAMNSRILAVSSMFLMSFSLSKLGVSWTLVELAALSCLGAVVTHIMAPKG
eukprot:Blabericola_migrator_1__3532@NODE_2049_length_3366_cov_58_519855_g1300_i0_p1_GENE_NODE_2049_length_3366_cov_58_519855_g1300_i0NODE_2049_length_3366_cov_58_519855_g1300_i0_p1_ORF_typecomplete_len569_score72_08Sugar_tr/PF00083_24/2_1e52MFS_1/PF07690_16/2_1e30MFS_1/PF07690_16/1e09TRI12/PF06609_13/1_6e09TRI12/PF06609_13/53TRI12/PF06609_13/1_2MFS_1_like/PF12832_7/5_3e06MFS_1_like/PF12832_7/0_21MFS_3/PF05977_13/0_0013MFS_3/PF05977_13/0_00097MFS_2/PF13347_6/0_0074MFS_2/PF13347_6/0_24MFS_2/PF13347_6/6_6